MWKQPSTGYLSECLKLFEVWAIDITVVFIVGQLSA